MLRTRPAIRELRSLSETSFSTPGTPKVHAVRGDGELSSCRHNYTLRTGTSEIAFTMTNNGQGSSGCLAARDLRERSFQIFGAGMLESLLPVSGGREYVAKVSGFVSALGKADDARFAVFFRKSAVRPRQDDCRRFDGRLSIGSAARRLSCCLFLSTFLSRKLT